MKELNEIERLQISGGKDATGCASAILGAGGMGAVAGAAAFSWAGPYIPIASGVGALVAGGYAAKNNPLCQ